MTITIINGNTGEEEVRELNAIEQADILKRDKEFDDNQSERILSGIKVESFRRIRLVLPEWMVERETTGGKLIPQEIKDQVAQIRLRSNELEANLTEDFLNDIYW